MAHFFLEQPVEMALPYGTHRVAEGAYARKNEAFGLVHFGRLRGDHRIETKPLQGVVQRAYIAHAVIQHGDHTYFFALPPTSACGPSSLSAAVSSQRGMSGSGAPCATLSG